MSGENTPTLTYVIQAFSSFIDLWEQYQKENPEWEAYIETGLSKLGIYQGLLTDIHVAAMGKLYLNLLLIFTKLLQHWSQKINFAFIGINQMQNMRKPKEHLSKWYVVNN